MPIRAHLVELRKRVVLAAAGLVVGAVGGWFLYDPVFVALQHPLFVAAAERHGVIALNFSGIASSLDMKI
ncbi:MAG TPA: twin-arginine translocase subunit TatC, partial [Coriobacteriia bacterium]|nr:twin-arginine translocase subunit TatC [Coriobacteriia bacterium]